MPEPKAVVLLLPVVSSWRAAAQIQLYSPHPDPLYCGGGCLQGISSQLHPAEVTVCQLCPEIPAPGAPCRAPFSQAGGKHLATRIHYPRFASCTRLVFLQLIHLPGLARLTFSCNIACLRAALHTSFNCTTEVTFCQ